MEKFIVCSTFQAVNLDQCGLLMKQDYEKILSTDLYKSHNKKSQKIKITPQKCFFKPVISKYIMDNNDECRIISVVDFPHECRIISVVDFPLSNY
ncbi:hypothetical protein BpHYR1_046610 [Brachionus plicatilis]|uniref:Uncharacterized protein n=1 Tax=Brachionus plicatilis TaxID=10195 RepID=A0A3M7QWV6_BRAPC|nr:hypothetical protein BpHYR1_046610 [Brachionus plicatilis]